MSDVLFSTDKLRKVVNYVGQTQPILEKVAAQESAMAAKIPGVVDALVRQGLLSPHLKAAKAEELKRNPVEILDLLEKTAALVTPKSLGTGDGKAAAVAAEKANDVFINRLTGNK